MTGLDSRGVSAAAKAPCPVCGKPIHALDGAMSSGGEPMRHTDCERAASIDYAAAFDILYQRALDNQRTVNALVEVTTQDDGEPWEHDGLLMQLYSDDSTSWSTYESCVLAVAGPFPDATPRSELRRQAAMSGECPICFAVAGSPADDRAAASPADERLREALRQAQEFAGNVIRFATGPVKPELWEDDSPLVEQAWTIAGLDVDALAGVSAPTGADERLREAAKDALWLLDAMVRAGDGSGESLPDGVWREAYEFAIENAAEVAPPLRAALAGVSAEAAPNETDPPGTADAPSVANQSPADAFTPNPYRSLRDEIYGRDVTWDEGFAAGLAARDTQDGECRAPHCWSEYGTPCATCPKEKR